MIDTTSNHLSRVPGTRGHGHWIKAAGLRHDTHLRTPGGTKATVIGGYVPSRSDGWMWDLTITPSHDFHINTTAADVLVHNCDTIDPKTVKFSQRSVPTRFKNGNTIEDTVAGIRSGEIDPNDFSPIRLVERNDDLYTLDNRRLVTFQKAGLGQVPYIKATPEEAAAEAWKFDPDAAGTSIKIRGTAEVWTP